MADPIRPTRQELAEFLPNQRAIRAFEKVFDLIPGDLITLAEGVEDNANAISSLDFDVIEATTSVSTEGNQVIICNNTSDITVTLNASPASLERVTVKAISTGKVTVSGSIDGTTELVIRRQYDAPSFVYTSSGWSLI